MLYINLNCIFNYVFLGLLQGYDAVMWDLQSTHASCKIITCNETLWTSS